MALPFNPFNIKIYVFAHLIFAFFGNLSGACGYNIGMAITLMWATYKYEDTEPLFVGIAAVFASVLLDITYLSIYGDGIINALPIGHSIVGAAKFSCAMTILSLLIKPWTIFVSLREFSRRGGDIKAYLPFAPSVGGAQAGYTGIPDSSEAPVISQDEGGQPAGIDAVPF